MPVAALSNPQAERLNKLRFRASRRGFVEADLILGGYAEARLPGMSAAELDQFEAFLDLPDQDLYAWIMNLAPMPANAPAATVALIGDIRRGLPHA